MLFLMCPPALRGADSALEQGFQTPPESVRVSVYWYWINDHISKEGVVRDLEAMSEVGLSGAYIGNIGEQTGAYGSVKLMSDEWWDITHEAVKTATRLGFKLGMFNSPGWSQSGGPWIKPDQSMRYLAFSELKVTGPQELEQKIPAPGENFQDVKTIAFPAPKNDSQTIQALNPRITSEPNLPGIETIADGKSETVLSIPANTPNLTVNLQVDRDFTARSLTLLTTAPSGATLEVSALENGRFRKIKTARFDRTNPELNVGFIPFAPVVIALPATTAKEFRLAFTEIRGGSFAEIQLSSAARVEFFAEKELAKMFPTPLPLWDAYLWPEQPTIDDSKVLVAPGTVRDISGSLRADGTLRWTVPEGDWIIQRTGMLSTGVKNSPATPEAKGLEVDKMSKKHAEYHFNSYFAKILERIPEADRKSLQVVVQDSYETGGQNWTDDFVAEFQQRYGYDPVAFIPVMNGRVVGSPDLSDRFLWDLRRLVADKVAYDYVGGLREVAHKHGMTTWLECYGHWGFPGEFLQYGGQSDGVAGEFWNEGTLGSIENRAASSCGHIYGKNVITAESFTAGGGVYERYPRLLKKRCDWSYTEGINESLLHLYIHQPYEDKSPGINAWFATEFNRKNTWFMYMKPFVSYIRRSTYMLQQGLNVADVAYFIGEDAPKMTGVCDPPLPEGYSFDYINGEIIRDKLNVAENKLTLPHGTSYRLLVLPQLQTMRPEILRKIKTLVEQGATVLGPAPNRSPSMQNYPQCDEEVKKLAAELWGPVDGKSVRVRKVGKGNICSGLSVQEALDLIKVAPDCMIDNPNTLYVHRTLSDGTEVYFLSNQIDEPIVFSAQFRVENRMPELWNAIDGTTRTLPAFEQKNGLTSVPMQLDAWESAFLVFRKNGKSKVYPSQQAALSANFPKPKLLSTLSGPWNVRFDRKKRGPEAVQVFNKLENWADSQNEAVKYYSGDATYQTTFTLSDLPKGKVLIDLGSVFVAATVKVNGKEAGMLWTNPWRMDITPFVQKGENTLEVEVVNTWINRLAGDARLPEAERKTWMTVNPITPETPLQTSGLLGPVTILNAE